MTSVRSNSNDSLGTAASSVVVLLGVPGVFFLVSQALRNSMGVIEGDLEREFVLSATQSGMLSGALFLAYAVAQVPLGIAIDRYGPRRVLALSILLLVSGTLLFAAASSFALLLGARIAIGIGAAPIYASVMGVVSRHTTAEHFSTYAGIESGIGRGGFLVAAAPLAWLAAAVGWRASFVVLAVITALCGAATLVALYPTRLDSNPAADSWTNTAAGLRTALTERGLAGFVGFQIASTGAALVVFAGWGTSWLQSEYGLGAVEAAQLLSVGALASALGAPAWGMLPRFFAHKWRATLIGGTILAALLALPAASLLSRDWLAIWLGAFGLASASYPLVLDQVRERLPQVLMVRGLTLLGVGSMAGAGVLLAASGTLIDRFAGVPGHHPPAAFAAMFTMLAALTLTATLLFAFDSRGRAVKEDRP